MLCMKGLSEQNWELEMQECLNGSGKMSAQRNRKVAHVQHSFMRLLLLIRLYMSVINSKGLLLLAKELGYA